MKMYSSRSADENGQPHLIADYHSDASKFKLGLHLPGRNFPPKFALDTEKFYCCGYYAGYDSNLSPEQISLLFRESQEQEIGSSNADYLIIYKDFQNQRLKVLTGQSGRFPLYFSTVGNHIVLGTSFGWVVRNIPLRHINWDEVFDYLYSNYIGLLTERTIIKEVWQVPPATLLTIFPDSTFELKPLLNPLELTVEEKGEYKNVEDFTRDFFELFKLVIKERLRSIGQNRFATELSSGFDISLVAATLSQATKEKIVAFSNTSTLSPGDNIQEISSNFALKHNLSVGFTNVDHLYPFSNEEGRKLLADNFFPANHSTELVLATRNRVKKQGYSIIFEGHGGDELYITQRTLEWLKFPIQEEYFWFVSGLKIGLEKIFTNEGLKQLISRERFCRKRLFPSLISTSALAVGLLHFPSYWKNGVWGIAPLTDTRLVKLARRVPELLSKQELWKGRLDIFVKEQFRPKEHYGKHVAQYLNDPKVKKFIIEVLSNSILAEAGFVNSQGIIDNLRLGNEVVYADKLMLYLQNVINLEYFLIKNNITT